MYLITFLFSATHYVPIFLDIMIPLAEPRQRRVLVVGEMFIDQNKYFHIVMLNIIVSSFFGVTTIIAAETMLMVLIQHVCGLLKVTRYYIPLENILLRYMCRIDAIIIDRLRKLTVPYIRIDISLSF